MRASLAVVGSLIFALLLSMTLGIYWPSHWPGGSEVNRLFIGGLLPPLLYPALLVWVLVRSDLKLPGALFFLSSPVLAFAVYRGVF